MQLDGQAAFRLAAELGARAPRPLSSFVTGRRRIDSELGPLRVYDDDRIIIIITYMIVAHFVLLSLARFLGGLRWLVFVRGQKRAAPVVGPIGGRRCTLAKEEEHLITVGLRARRRSNLTGRSGRALSKTARRKHCCCSTNGSARELMMMTVRRFRPST